MDWWLRDTAIRNHGNGKTIKESNTLIISYKQKRGLRRKNLEQIDPYPPPKRQQNADSTLLFHGGWGLAWRQRE
jgi:hypothetical protein